MKTTLFVQLGWCGAVVQAFMPSGTQPLQKRLTQLHPSPLYYRSRVLPSRVCSTLSLSAYEWSHSASFEDDHAKALRQASASASSDFFNDSPKIAIARFSLNDFIDEDEITKIIETLQEELPSIEKVVGYSAISGSKDPTVSLTLSSAPSSQVQTFHVDEKLTLHHRSADEAPVGLIRPGPQKVFEKLYGCSGGGISEQQQNNVVRTNANIAAIGDSVERSVFLFPANSFVRDEWFHDFIDDLERYDPSVSKLGEIASGRSANVPPLQFVASRSPATAAASGAASVGSDLSRPRYQIHRYKSGLLGLLVDGNAPPPSPPSTSPPSPATATATTTATTTVSRRADAETMQKVLDSVLPWWQKSLVTNVKWAHAIGF